MQEVILYLEIHTSPQLHAIGGGGGGRNCQGSGVPSPWSWSMVELEVQVVEQVVEVEVVTATAGAGGAGNNPPTTPPQGNRWRSWMQVFLGGGAKGGGGGANAAGTAAAGPPDGKCGTAQVEQVEHGKDFSPIFPGSPNCGVHMLEVVEVVLKVLHLHQELVQLEEQVVVEHLNVELQIMQHQEQLTLAVAVVELVVVKVQDVQLPGAGGSGIVIVKELDKASGVWSLADQLDALEDGTWPKRTVNVDYMVVAGGGAGARGDVQVVEVVQEVIVHQVMDLVHFKVVHKN